MKPTAETQPEIPLAATIPMLKKHGAVLASIGCRRIEIRYTPTRCPYLVGFVGEEGGGPSNGPDDAADEGDHTEEDNLMGDKIDNV